MGSTIKQRLRRYNGTDYDTIHLETETSCISDFPSTMPPSAHTHPDSDITGFYSRPNLLRNWYFIGGGASGNFPLNSAGKTSYSVYLSPCIDSWMATGTITLQSYGIDVTGVLYQEPDSSTVTSLIGKTCTLSILYSDGILESGSGVYESSPSSNINFFIGSRMYGGVLSETNSIFIAPVTEGATYRIAAIKLELGSTQTLAHLENGVWVLTPPAPDYQEEILRCADGFNPRVGKGINLLDNWYLVGDGTPGTFPINHQYPKTEFAGPGYGINRWWSATNGATVTLSSSGLRVTYTTTNCGLYQFFADDYILPGVQYTGSMLFSDGTLLTGSAIADSNGAYTEFARNAKTAFGIRKFTKDNVLKWCFVFANITTDPIELVAMKLELGSQQTLARQVDGVWVLNDTLPNYQEEILRCSDGFTPLVGKGENLLDNWYFIGGGTPGKFPVNQKGATSYNTTGAICIDRWVLNQNTLSLTAAGLKSATSSLVNLIQYFEDARIDDGQTYTLSVLTDTGCVSISAVLDKSATPSSGWQMSTPAGNGAWAGLKHDPAGSPGKWHLRLATSSDSTIIKAVKLELGNRQTLARMVSGTWVLNDTPPNYQEEVLRCSDGFTPSVGKGINLLDNWYFIGGGSQSGDGIFPINQRGNASYTSGKMIDRWYTWRTDGRLDIVSDGIELVTTTTGNVANHIRQRFAKPLPQGTYTLSALIDHIGGGGGETHSEVNFRNAAQAYLYAGASTTGTGLQLISATYTGNEAQVFEVCTKQATSGTTKCKILAIKLEKGPVQTLAHLENGEWVLNDAPPNYQQELAKCQRYTQVITGGEYASIGWLYAATSTSISIGIPLLVSMYGTAASIEAQTTAYASTNGGWAQSITIPATSQTVRLSTNAAKVDVTLPNTGALLGTFPCAGELSSDGNTKLIIDVTL